MTISKIKYLKFHRARSAFSLTNAMLQAASITAVKVLEVNYAKCINSQDTLSAEMGELRRRCGERTGIQASK